MRLGHMVPWYFFNHYIVISEMVARPPTLPFSTLLLKDGSKTQIWTWPKLTFQLKHLPLLLFASRRKHKTSLIQPYQSLVCFLVKAPYPSCGCHKLSHSPTLTRTDLTLQQRALNTIKCFAHNNLILASFGLFSLEIPRCPSKFHSKRPVWEVFLTHPKWS